MKNLIEKLKMFLYKNTNLNNTNGITLIALVITIIVLLILAGVTIATLTGNNGILTKASEAKEKTEEAKEEELRKLTQAEAATHLENSTHTDKSTGKEETVTIPAGFAVSQVEGENTIEDGLVIIDKNGNEFVWVPVDFEQFEREHLGTSEQKWWSGTFVTDELSANNMYEPISDGIKNSTEVEKMYKSVKDYGGFYVGRYEAGTTAESGTGIRGKVVCKKAANIYNNIGFADTNDITDETGGAVEVARSMYAKEKGDNVTSTLIYGVQWDAIMRWMKDKSNLTGGKYVQDSTGMGWYSDSYENENPTHQTGIDIDSNKSNSVNNIYDLAGNVYEWTMESYDSYYRVNRGGDCNGSGLNSPASKRNYYNPSDSRSNFGFRITLYLN